MRQKYFLRSLSGLLFLAGSYSAFACEVSLSNPVRLGFVERGALGAPSDYLQRVYSSQLASFSTLVFLPVRPLIKEQVMKSSARMMLSVAQARSGEGPPQVNALDSKVLPQIDRRLVFLTYLIYERNQKINLEAAAALKSGACWAILRFTGLSISSRDASLNVFANLIHSTLIEEK